MAEEGAEGVTNSGCTTAQRASSRGGEADEASAERSYRAAVEAQRAAEATGVPRLSARAMAAIGTVAAALHDQARAEAWRAAQADPPSRTNCAPSARRFGEDGVRAMLAGRRSCWYGHGAVGCISGTAYAGSGGRADRNADRRRARRCGDRPTPRRGPAPRAAAGITDVTLIALGAARGPPLPVATGDDTRAASRKSAGFRRSPSTCPCAPQGLRRRGELAGKTVIV